MSGGLDVRLRGVVHLYPSPEGDVVALRGVDLDVDAGECMSLLGPSGAGKSTVLGLIAGDFAPSAGQVMIGGRDIARLDGRELARLRALEVSLVVQGAERNLLPYATAEENVWFAQEGARRRGRSPQDRPRELLDRFGLAAHAGLPVERLSAGQRQQVALAAGVATRPPLLLVDEPTNRLDVASRDRVAAMLRAISTDLGTTVIMVTHDVDVAAAMGRTVTILDGRVGGEGRHGVDYAVVGRDGSVRLPPEALDVLPPGSRLQVVRREDRVELFRVNDEDDPS